MSAARRLLAAVALGAALVACNNPGADASPAAAGADFALGAPNAKVTIVEYASPACGHCATFHKEVWPALKTNYVDTGKVRYVFRGVRTGEPTLAAAGLLTARCQVRDSADYLNRMGVLFDQQRQIFAAAGKGEARQAFAAIALSAGIDDETFTACLNDPAGIKSIKASEAQFDTDLQPIPADQRGTPAFVINGAVVPPEGGYPYERLSKLLDEALAK